MTSAKLFSLLFLIPIVYAQIEIEIVASTDENERQVKASGSNVNIISDKDRNTFKLSDNNLKNAVNAYFGKRPDDAYLKSPTPWGDLYKTYGWPQVTTILTPQKASILGVTSQPTVVLTQVFKNNSSKKASFKAQISQKVENTVSSTWQTGGELTIGQEIKYGFDIKVFAVSGTTKFSYTAKYGESVSRSETVTVGSESGVEITLEPYQEVTAELQATRGTMKVQMFYEASLSGSSAVNYASPYKGHHFWALPINGVMSSGGLKQTVESNEVIEIGFYSDSRIIIRDSKTNEVLFSIPVEIY